MPEPVDGIAALAATISGMRAARPAASGRLIVGLVGAPGAGKSTIAAALSAALPGSAVLPMDGFHLPQAELVSLGRRERMGAPDTFDVDGFVALLQRVRAAEGARTTLRAPGFDRAIEEPVPEAIALTPEASTVIVEGNYLLLDESGWQRVAPLLDLSVAIVLDEPTRHERLIARHIASGKSPQAARDWALGPDEANARRIAATLIRADRTLTAR